MDKKKVIIFGIGGVALVGIALYLYNKSKNTTRSGTELETSEDSMMGNQDSGMSSLPTANRPSAPSGAGAVIPTNMPTPSGIVAPVIIPPTGDTSGAYSLNPSGGFVDDKFTTTTTTSPSTSGTKDIVPSTLDVDTFVDPSTKIITTTTSSPTITTSPVLTKGFDGSFSYANGRRMRTRRLFNL